MCADEAALLNVRSTSAPLLWDGRQDETFLRDCPGGGDGTPPARAQTQASTCDGSCPGVT
jgi:hypothetical protein